MGMMRLRREDPRIVGPYRLHRRLGAGGMGVVYLGSDRKGQRVALKLIRAELAEDSEFRTRFAREVAAASRIRAGATARVVGSDIEADRPWLATAYVPGPSLYKRVGDEGPLAWPEVARIGAALADGLVKVHEAGVVHRDLKPSNILLSPKGPRIIDFGIAWSRGASTLTHVGTAVGSPGFLAPEQVRGAAVTPATDVFAFGATLAYALTGDTPFGSGASSEVMLYRVVHEEPDLSEVPPVLAPLIGACLAKEPLERPGAAHLHERLSELAARAGGRRAAAAAEPVATQASAPRAREQARVGSGSPLSAAELAAREAARAEKVARESEEARALGRPRFARSQPHPSSGGHPTVPARPAPRPAARPVPRPAPGPARDRQHTPPPTGGLAARRRLLRQRLVVFITVTIGVALAIAAAQGCENRHAQGLPAPAVPSTSSLAQPAVQGAAAVPPIGLSADGAQPAAHTSGSPLPAGFGPAAGSVPQVDWPNRSYPDPSGGPAIQLQNGRSAGPPAVALSAVMPARYRGNPAQVVVLRRTEGAMPVDLVELFTFSGDSPALATARTSAADPSSTATWRLDEGALVREERVPQTGAVATTRYAVRGDGSLEESWPGAGVAGGTGAGGTPAP
ncbi:serine/threonine protein kinase [Kitasatospora viridis]|uniref:Serine/threonine protein kinase n=2 Tax=Kitasatospora viridis TaxID=281105 RepID=A0A561UAM4_9ACTN|nr:serine/threonine protein kinase [Kitasatospora viridis]